MLQYMAKGPKEIKKKKRYHNISEPITKKQKASYCCTDHMPVCKDIHLLCVK